jgi:hypothetical protein
MVTGKKSQYPLRDIDNFVFSTDFDKSANVIKRKNDKRSFFVSFDKLHISRNVKKNNEINFRAIIVRAIKHRGSGRLISVT